MAKRKHTTKRRTHRRKRMSGIGDSLEMVLFAGIGAIGTRVLSQKILPTLNPEVKAIGFVAVGILLPKMVKGTIGNGIGIGMASEAFVELGQAMNFISGAPLVMAGNNNGNLSLIAAPYNNMLENQPMSVIAGTQMKEMKKSNSFYSEGF